MAFNVNEFRASLKGDGARPNLFEFTMSTGGLSIGDIASEMAFKCRVAQIPESNLGMIPVTYFGREIKVAGNRTFPELTVTVINDEDFKIRRAMETWMSKLNSHVGNLRDTNYTALGAAGRGESYAADGLLTQFGKEGPAKKQYKFVGCWPTNVSAIDLDWGANDQIEEFQITFAFQWWESVDSTDGSTSSVPAGLG